MIYPWHRRHIGPSSRPTSLRPRPARSLNNGHPGPDPGWYETATAWIKAELAQLGHNVIDPIEPVRNWSLSYVLRARTATDTFYFKADAALPLFVNEATLLSRLAAYYPDHIPMPLSIDRERRWMLLADFG